MTEIKDIRFLTVDEIPCNEYIVVDTNILLFKFYSRLSEVTRNSNGYQLIYYPDFIATLLNNGNRLLTTYLNMAEFCSVIEKIERNIYNAPLPPNSRVDLKEFRDLAYERNIYLTNLKRALRLVKKDIFYVYEITHDCSVVNSFVQALPETHCDIADFTVIEYMKSLGITNFISDDKDFTTVDGITLYTTYKDSHYQTQTTDDRSNSTNSGRSDGRRSNTNLNRLNVFSSSRPQSHSQSH